MRETIGALQEHIEREEDRLRREQEQNYRRWREEERVKLEQRSFSGADCGWTKIDKSEALYCRRKWACVPHRTGQRQALDPVSC
jgi:hypothetical protein